MKLIKLLGLMSVQFALTNSIHDERLLGPYPIAQPAGTSIAVGHRECCPSSLISTKYWSSSFSNGLAIDSSSGSFLCSHLCNSHIKPYDVSHHQSQRRRTLTL